jgi:hypothetical protein
MGQEAAGHRACVTRALSGGHTGTVRIGMRPIIAVALWLLMVLPLGGILLFEWSDSPARFSLSCPAPQGDSEYGPSTWQWWPPGEVCHWNGRRTGEPGPWRGAWTTAVILGGVVLLVATRRRDGG